VDGNLSTTGRSSPLANTRYMRPAEWPPSMHKCARDPALPLAPCCRHLCTNVQRWDPTLPRVPRRVPLCTHVQRRARTQFDRCVHTGPPWSVWPGKSSRAVHKAGQESAENQGSQTLGSLPRCRVRSPAGGAGGKAPAGGAGAAPRSPPPVTSRHLPSPSHRPPIALPSPSHTDPAPRPSDQPVRRTSLSPRAIPPHVCREACASPLPCRGRTARNATSSGRPCARRP
jgi:hypothetical protein